MIKCIRFAKRGTGSNATLVVVMEESKTTRFEIYSEYGQLKVSSMGSTTDDDRDEEMLKAAFETIALKKV